MWDRKRQLVWVIGGVVMGTYVAFSNAVTDDKEFSLSFFIFMELLILLIMAGLWYLYSRKG